MDEEDLEAMENIFLMFHNNFVKIYQDSWLSKSLTNEEHKKLLEIVGQSVSQTKKDIMDVFDDAFNEEKIEGDKKRCLN